MSGIVALIGAGSKPDAVERMLQSAPHRGSVSDVWSSDGVCLGVQNRDGGDPFVAAGLHAEDDIAVALTGSLFTDSSTISGGDAAHHLAARYRKEGPATLEQANGSFAVVVAHPRTKHALAVRSVPGERPLFWQRDGARFAAASEPKQLLASPLPRSALDLDAVMDVLTFTFRDPGRTAYADIKRLVPGSTVTTGERSLERRFFDPRDHIGTTRIELGDAVAEFRRLLETAVHRRLRKGTGLLLSGGLDSGAVASVAAPTHVQRFGEPLVAVSATYPDHPTADESRFVGMFCERLGCRVHWVTPRPHPFEDLDRRARLFDGSDFMPMYSNFAQIVREARDTGLTTCLDGHDGDTVFGTQGGVPLALLRAGDLRATARHLSFMRKRHGYGRAAAVRRVLLPPLINASPLLHRVKERIRPGDDATPPWVVGELRERLSSNGTGVSWAARQAELLDFGLTSTLESLERVSQQEGITLLHPLADQDLVRFLVGLKPGIQYATGGTKSLVRLACSNLPDEIRWRVDKTHFDDVLIGSSTSEGIVEALRNAPRVLPGVDWSRLEAGARSETAWSFRELSLLGMTLSADLFVAAG